MAPFTEQLLTNLFKALTLPGSSENEYIMKGEPEFDDDSDDDGDGTLCVRGTFHKSIATQNASQQRNVIF